MRKVPMKVKVPVKEVKVAFLLADAFKDIVELSSLPSFQELERCYQDMKKRYEETTEEKLDEQIIDKVRLYRYNYMDWYLGYKNLSRIGVWPKMHGLPIELTTGSVIDTAKDVERFPEKVPRDLNDRLHSIINLREFVYPRFPIILFPGREVRESDYNKWAKKQEEPVCSNLCEILDYTTDDGSCRAVAYALEGFEQVEAYFGEYKK